MYTRWCNTVCNSNMLEKFFLPMPPPSAPPWREHLIAYLSNYVAAGDEWRLRSLQLLSFSGRGGGRELERGGPREDGTPNPAGAFFFFTANGGGNLSFLCVYEWWYVRGFLLVLRASFRGLTGAQWWNCGKMWEGGGGGKSLDCFKVMKGDGGESGCVEYIFPFEIIDRAYHLGVVVKDQLIAFIVRSCGSEISLNFALL